MDLVTQCSKAHVLAVTPSTLRVSRAVYWRCQIRMILAQSEEDGLGDVMSIFMMPCKTTVLGCVQLVYVLLKGYLSGRHGAQLA